MRVAAPDGGGIQCGALDGSGRPLWDLGKPCSSIAVDAGGKHVLVAGAGFVAVLSSDGDILWQGALPGEQKFAAAKGFAWISSDGKRLLVADDWTAHVTAFAGGISGS